MKRCLLFLSLAAGVGAATNPVVTAEIYMFGQHLETFTNCVGVSRCTNACQLVKWVGPDGKTNEFHAWNASVVVKTNEVK